MTKEKSYLPVIIVLSFGVIIAVSFLAGLLSPNEETFSDLHSEWLDLSILDNPTDAQVERIAYLEKRMKELVKEEYESETDTERTIRKVKKIEGWEQEAKRNKYK